MPEFRLREPFPEHSDNPESIEDVIFFQRSIDGNLSLYYALRTMREWSDGIMQQLYDGLYISPEGKIIFTFLITLFTSLLLPLIPFYRSGKQNECLSNNLFPDD